MGTDFRVPITTRRRCNRTLFLLKVSVSPRRNAYFGSWKNEPIFDVVVANPRVFAKFWGPILVSARRAMQCDFCFLACAVGRQVSKLCNGFAGLLKVSVSPRRNAYFGSWKNEPIFDAAAR